MTRSQTMVFGAPTRRTEAWRVYRIRTANSEYELEVQEPGGARRCTVLTKLAGEAAVQSFEDSQPRVGERCLYDVSPLEWMGQPLAVGTACTTPIQSVDFVRHAPLRTQRAAATPKNTLVFSEAPARASRPAPAPDTAAPAPKSWAPFPLGCVEMLEAAASVLGAVCHQPSLASALEGDPRLAKRYRLALAQCGVLLETLDARARDA
ncbi:MAG: hypothetical protein JNJ54_13285 [Myxococcaceae bacterium]|nr:hypothetical protein [Myxococcaceae bacterium]